MKLAGCKVIVNKAKFILFDKKRPLPISIPVLVRVCGAGTDGSDVRNSSSSSNPDLPATESAAFIVETKPDTQHDSRICKRHQ